jgi:hypothetical protein
MLHTPRAAGAIALAAGFGLSGAALLPLEPSQSGAPDGPTLEETRVTMGKWIETQQIIGRERNEWTQGKEILKGRIELVAKEVATLDEKIKQSQANVAESKKGYEDLVAEREQLKATAAQLAASVAKMEQEVRRIAPMLPDSLRLRLAPLFTRLPEDPATTKVSVAERFQNVLGILNEVNKANGEITVVYEVRALPDGTNAEVQCLYVGLAQAYFVSPRGDAGIGRPTPDGWKWEAAPAEANRILTALEIIQGKHVPAFVPLPVKIQ